MRILISLDVKGWLGQMGELCLEGINVSNLTRPLSALNAEIWVVAIAADRRSLGIVYRGGGINCVLVRRFPSPWWGSRVGIRLSMDDFSMVVIRSPGVLGSVMWLYSIFCRRPIVIESVGDSFEALLYHGSWKGVLVSPVFWIAQKIITLGSSDVIYVAKCLFDKFPTNGRCIFVTDVQLPSNGLLLKARIQKNPIRIGMMGSLSVKYKGHADVIKTLSLLIAGGFDVVVSFLGSGDNRKLREYANSLGIVDRVFFEGTLPSGQAVHDWLHSLDFYVQPSYTEGLPRSVLEAMALGLPVVCSTAGDMPLLVGEEMCIAPGDSCGMAKLIAGLICNRALCAEVIQRNFRTLKSYAASDMVSRRSAFYLSAFRRGLRYSTYYAI